MWGNIRFIKKNCTVTDTFYLFMYLWLFSVMSIVKCSSTHFVYMVIARWVRNTHLYANQNWKLEIIILYFTNIDLKHEVKFTQHLICSQLFLGHFIGLNQSYNLRYETQCMREKDNWEILIYRKDASSHFNLPIIENKLG